MYLNEQPIYVLVVNFCHNSFNQAAAFLSTTSLTKITKYSYFIYKFNPIELIGCTAIPSISINACFNSSCFFVFLQDIERLEGKMRTCKLSSPLTEHRLGLQKIYIQSIRKQMEKRVQG